MITLRPAAERGHANHGWLDSHHTFSFGDYHHPAHMGFRSLRVLNDDRVSAGMGFGTHGHRDMEIVSYVLEGALAHRDSMGNGSTMRYGEVQRMSAGTGVMHSEFNASKSEPVHFLQIWIVPARQGVAPGYEQRSFAPEEKRARLRLVASPDGAEGSVAIHADARLYSTVLAAGERVERAFAKGRGGYVHVARGEVRLGAHTLRDGDGAALEAEEKVVLEGGGAGDDLAEVLVFDLA